MNYLLALVALFALAGPAKAQGEGDRHRGGHSPSESPYAGFEQRPVKSLSDHQLEDLRAGRGMGLALAAELNGYPGPLHVLELADALALTDDQRTRNQSLLEAMKAETIAIGERIITEEAGLDRLFAERQIAPNSVTAATARIGALQGELRAAHLRYHLTMSDFLTPEQIARITTGAATDDHRDRRCARPCGGDR